MLNSISCTDQTQTAPLPIQTWCLPSLLHQVYRVSHRSFAMPHSCLVDIGDQHILEASRWSCPGPSEVLIFRRRSLLYRWEQVEIQSSWDGTISETKWFLSYVPQEPTTQQAREKSNLVGNKKQIWMHWTYKAHGWLDCLFCNLKKLLKNKILKITNLYKFWGHYPDNSECCFITTV